MPSLQDYRIWLNYGEPIYDKVPWMHSYRPKQNRPLRKLSIFLPSFMDEIFDFLNKTYEASGSVLGSSGKIIGYANDGYEVEGVFSLNDREFNFLITDGEPGKYTLRLTKGKQTTTHEHLTAREIIGIFQTGDLPIFQLA